VTVAAVQTNRDVFSRLREHREAIRSLGVGRLGVFGSFTRNEQHDESDVDVLVEFEKDKKNFDRFMELAFLLEDILQRRVELVTVESLSPHIGPRILAEVQDVPLGT
jgi:predicted nucleotidyltransferase